MNGWIIRYFDLPTLWCRLMRFLGFVPRCRWVAGGYPDLLWLGCRCARWAVPPCSRILTQLPVKSMGVTLASNSTTPNLLFYVQFPKAAPSPCSPCFLPSPHTLPAWPPTRAFGFSRLRPNLPSLGQPFSACALQGEWWWSNCGLKSRLQVIYQELVMHSSLLKCTNLFCVSLVWVG